MRSGQSGAPHLTHNSGMLDDVRFYNRALTDLEIATHVGR